MKVIIFTDSYLPHRNGVSSSIDRQVKTLKKNSNNVLTVGPNNLETDIKIKSKIIFKTSDPRFSLFVPIKPFRKLRSIGKIDILHIHTPFSFGVLGLIYAKKYKIPVVYTHHTDFSHYFHYVPALNNMFGKKASFFFYNKFLNCIDIIITPSEDSKDKLLSTYKIDKKKIRVIHTPIELNTNIYENTHQKKSFDLVFIGRLSPEKNIFLIGNVIKSLLSKLPKMKIALIGDGIKKQWIQLKLKNFINKNVFFLGEMNNIKVQDIIKTSRFCLFPSITETQGLVIQEAWANGVPIITVSCKLTRKVIKNGINGWVCLNSHEDLEKTIFSLIKSKQPDLNQIFNCINSAKKYSTKNWYKIYRNMLSEELSI